MHAESVLTHSCPHVRAAPAGSVVPAVPMVGCAGADAAAVLSEAESFLRLHHSEHPDQRLTLTQRLSQIRAEVDSTGTYVHTLEELTFGARVAWRNASRCIGRLYWNTLQVRDLRHVTAAEDIHRELCEHLRRAGSGRSIHPIISVFAPDAPGRPAARVWNDQLIRYAGHRRADGTVLGDPAYVEFTDLVCRLGWRPRGGRFEVLPLVIEAPDDKPQLFELPADVVVEVPLVHPEYPWFEELDLRWHAIPAISNMRLGIGGVDYALAPFNGWYMGTEIGGRNLVDHNRYNMLPVVAERLGLDISREASLWKDRALIEINIAVLHSFKVAGIKITDHHAESRHFLRHVAMEESRGRIVPVDWSWIVPPVSGGITPVFHRYYDEADLNPRFHLDHQAKERAQGRCPHIDDAGTAGRAPLTPVVTPTNAPHPPTRHPQERSSWRQASPVQRSCGFGGTGQCPARG